jgi:predicted helicase
MIPSIPGEISFFKVSSTGVGTNRDAWAFNFSRTKVLENMKKMISVYNADVDKFVSDSGSFAKQTDPKKIKWSSSLVANLERKKRGDFNPDAAVVSLYRPFQKSHLYLDGMFNHRVSKIPQIWDSADDRTPAILCTGMGASTFAALMTFVPPCLDAVEKAVVFPFKVRSSVSKENAIQSLWDEAPSSDSNITQEIKIARLWPFQRKQRTAR